MNTTLAIARTLLRIYSRDRQAIFFTLFFPVTFMIIFGFLNTGDTDPIEIGVVDQAGNEFSASFIDALASNELFSIRTGEEGALRAETMEGDLALTLILPPDLDVAGSATNLTMLVDAAQARETAMLIPVIEQALLSIEREVRDNSPLFPVQVVDVQARTQRYIDFLVPGLLAMSIMQISVAGSGYNIVEYRRKGILKRLFVTPLRSSHFIGGIVLARLLITVIQVCFLLTMAVLLLDVPIAGNLLELLVLMLFGSSIFLSLGFAMGSIAKTQQAIMLMGNLITLPQMFLSGVFFSVDSMPAALQGIAKLLPLTWLVQAVRDNIVDGVSLFSQLAVVLALLVWGVIGLTLAIRLFRWKEIAA